MENVLLDQQLAYLIQAEFSEYLKDYDGKYFVGKDIKKNKF